MVRWSRADDQERILETSVVQKVGFIKAWGQDPWAEELREVMTGNSLHTLGLGGGQE